MVDDVQQRWLSITPEPAYYVIRTARRAVRRSSSTLPVDSTALRSAIRDEARRLDPQMAVDIERASSVVDAGLSRQRLGIALILGFGMASCRLRQSESPWPSPSARRSVVVRRQQGSRWVPRRATSVAHGEGTERRLALAGAVIELVVAYAVPGRAVLS